jgi:hypothetical protein
MRLHAIIVFATVLGCGGTQDYSDRASAAELRREDRDGLSRDPMERRSPTRAPTHLPSYVPPEGSKEPGTPVRTAGTHDPMPPSAGTNTSGAAKGTAPAGYFGPRPEDARRMRAPGAASSAQQGKVPRDSQAVREAAATASEGRSPSGESDPDEGTTGEFGGPPRGAPTE